MRYVRTKDELGIEREDGTCCFRTWVASSDSPLKKDWLYADTIEELIDKYVIYLPYKNIYDVSGVNYLRRAVYYFGEICYGAIWTDKGLIYVAKWNKESDKLELL